ISAGEDAVFAIAVFNPGPGTAFDTTLTDDLPGTLTWSVSSVTSVNGGPTPACTISNSHLACDPVDLAAARGYAVTIRATTTPNDCGELSNTASLAVDNDANADPIDSNAAPLFINCSDISVKKVADAEVVSAGDQIGFTITVVNNGDGTAFDATLSDT